MMDEIVSFEWLPTPQLLGSHLVDETFNHNIVLTVTFVDGLTQEEYDIEYTPDIIPNEEISTVSVTPGNIVGYVGPGIFPKTIVYLDQQQNLVSVDTYEEVISPDELISAEPDTTLTKEFSFTARVEDVDIEVVYHIEIRNDWSSDRNSIVQIVESTRG